MKKTTFIFSLILLGSNLVAGRETLAAGGGGGGGGGTVCSEYVWVCGDWGTCSSESKQTRICTLTFDCPFVTNPKPQEQQSCTQIAPAPTAAPTTAQPAIATTPAAARPPIPTPTSKPDPTTAPAVVPICNKNNWRCETWSACDKDGNQIRQCTQATICLVDLSNTPAEVQRCATLQCGYKRTMRERIFCRLGLAPAGIARELELQYLPEECRAMKNRVAQKACVAKYKLLKPCFEISGSEARTACARQALGLDTNAQADIALCAAKTGRKKTACQVGLREKMYSLTKFGLYDREDQAEDALMKGADINATADFVTLIETKKQQYNAMKTDKARDQIVREVDEAWKKFVKQIPAFIE